MRTSAPSLRRSRWIEKMSAVKQGIAQQEDFRLRKYSAMLDSRQDGTNGEAIKGRV